MSHITYKHISDLVPFERVKILIDALEFYANDKNYDPYDGNIYNPETLEYADLDDKEGFGVRARAALKEFRGEK